MIIQPHSVQLLVWRKSQATLTPDPFSQEAKFQKTLVEKIFTAAAETAVLRPDPTHRRFPTNKVLSDFIRRKIRKGREDAKT